MQHEQPFVPSQKPNVHIETQIIPESVSNLAESWGKIESDQDKVKAMTELRYGGKGIGTVELKGLITILDVSKPDISKDQIKEMIKILDVVSLTDLTEKGFSREAIRGMMDISPEYSLPNAKKLLDVAFDAKKPFEQPPEVHH